MGFGSAFPPTSLGRRWSWPPQAFSRLRQRGADGAPRDPRLPEVRGQTVGSFRGGLQQFADAMASSVSEAGAPVRLGWKLRGMSWDVERREHVLEFDTPDGARRLRIATMWVACVRVFLPQGSMPHHATPLPTNDPRRGHHQRRAQLTQQFPSTRIFPKTTCCLPNSQTLTLTHARRPGAISRTPLESDQPDEDQPYGRRRRPSCASVLRLHSKYLPRSRSAALAQGVAPAAPSRGVRSDVRRPPSAARPSDRGSRRPLGVVCARTHPSCVPGSYRQVWL